jgi:uncharacterized protein
MTHARDLVDVVARALVDEPDAVSIVETEHHGQIVIELRVAPGDLGRVIGRQGRTVAALRTLVAATAERDGKKAAFDVREASPARG